jgi:hypothetical protein
VSGSVERSRVELIVNSVRESVKRGVEPGARGITIVGAVTGKLLVSN